MKALLFLAFVSMVFFATIQGAVAFKFSPFRAKFEPSGAAANQLFTVENNTDEPASVQIRITTREMDVDGGEKDADDEKDFMIYPAQLVLEPHTSRSVRVQWAGDPNLKEEKAFRIIAEQLPVNLSKEKPKSSSVRFLVSYHGALFVTPPGLAHNVTLDFAGTMHDTAGRKILEIVLHNRGTQHALLRNLKLDIKDDKGNTISLSGPDQLKGVTGETILEKHERRFLIPWPSALVEKPKHIDITFDKEAF